MSKGQRLRSALAPGGVTTLTYLIPYTPPPPYHLKVPYRVPYLAIGFFKAHIILPTNTSIFHQNKKSSDDSHHFNLFASSLPTLSSGAFATLLLIRHVVARSVGLPIMCHAFANSLPSKHTLIPGTICHQKFLFDCRH